MKLYVCCLKVFIFLCFVFVANGTLSKQPKKKNVKEKSQKFQFTKTNRNVIAKGLVNADINAEDILANHYKICDAEKAVRHFSTGQVLGYVTPWNGHGYDVAKTFGKFTMLSPVWLQIKRKPRGKYHVTGTHDIDKSWVKDARKANDDVQMLPRVLFDGWSASDFKGLFSSEDEVENMLEALTQILIENDFDGAVIELWSQLPRKKSKEAIHVIKHMSEEFHAKDLTLVLVIPPPINFEGKPTAFDSDHFKQLAPLVDGFSLMTYDFGAGSGKSLPNAPVSWMKGCVEHLDPRAENRKKILLGLNFYGYVYATQGSSALLGGQFIEMVRSYPSDFIWEDKIQEHIVMQNISDSHKSVIMYPTLQSIQSRLSLAKELGTGIAIWELGQGLDYFYDLL